MSETRKTSKASKTTQRDNARTVRLMGWNEIQMLKRLNTDYRKTVLRCSVSDALINSDDIIYKTSDKGKQLVRIV